MDLFEKIQQQKQRYYKYTIQCIDAYLESDIEPLKNFLINLLKMDKGQVVLEDDFIPLVDAYKHHDTSTLLDLRRKFENEINDGYTPNE